MRRTFAYLIFIVWSAGSALAQAVELDSGLFIHTFRWESATSGQFRFATIYDRNEADDPGKSVQFMLAFLPSDHISVDFAYVSAHKGKVSVNPEDDGSYYIKVPSFSILDSYESGRDLVVQYQGDDATFLRIPGATIGVVVDEAFDNAPEWLRERW